MSIAWDNLEKIHKVQLKHCRPDLSEEHERRKEERCPELYERPLYVNGEIKGENTICKLNYKACVIQSGGSCYIYDEFLNKSAP